MLVWTFFLLRGIRWIWIATVVVGALGIAVNLVTDSGTWHGDFIGLIAAHRAKRNPASNPG